jgi:2-dehydro-3-deoxyphosphooctonate aldolase (KDO 8-P synthase)
LVVTAALFGRPLDRARPLLISGPCVIESEALCMEVATHLRDMAKRLDIVVVFKASFDKANRTSGQSYRGVGLDEGLQILARVRAETGLPVLTDVHSVEQVAPVAAVVDMLQTPAFLARQTDLIEAVATCGKPVNIKKAQFMAPGDMRALVAKARSARTGAGGRTGDATLFVCERGSSFGYNNLVVDMRGLVQMRDTGCPVIFDATHSVQQPGGLGDRSGGQREFVEPLARAAVAIGVEGLFMECHPRPDEALSDGPNAVPLAQLEPMLRRLLALAAAGHSATTPDDRER